MGRKYNRKQNVANSDNFRLKHISPKNDRQAHVLDSDRHLILQGVAGTGKTFISSYVALRDVVELGEYHRLVYLRSAVPTRDIGFLPGNVSDKASVYEQPYKDICSELFSRGDAYDILVKKGYIDFVTTSFIRGTTINNSVIIVDECQNMSFHELDSIITRVGWNSRIIFCGDYNQSDLKDSGIKNFFDILNHINSFDQISFGIDDIVRSGLVKKYIIAKHSRESSNK